MRRAPAAPPRRAGGAALLTALLLASCSSGLPAADPMPEATTSVAGTVEPPATTAGEIASETTDGPSLPAGTITVDVHARGTPIDRRLFGTNVPAWLGPERLREPWLLDALAAAGISTIRMPGGSWSNEYGWSACELREAGCIWEGAARPSDFAGLLVDTALEGIWTVSINETAQSAAALVAFFNGDVDDTRVIGSDRNGVDWGTVGDWAARREAGGHPEPVRIGLWEIGNEVYGGRPDTGGAECASFGWEAVWTCDGSAYVLGDDEHDGYLEIRRAMREVDPSIEVGAVGVADPAGWTNWGNEVITEAGDALDFYIVHQYGFDGSPSPAGAAGRAGELWPPIFRNLRRSLGDVPIAVTEYNLVSFESGDTARSMTTVANAIFIADTLGRFAQAGVEIANQWNLANGVTASGTDYGLVHADTGAEYPQFAAMAAWGRSGDDLLPIDGGLHAAGMYASRRADGSVHVIVLRAAESDPITLAFSGSDSPTVTATAMAGAEPNATTLAPTEVEVRIDAGTVTFEPAPWSITELEVVPG